MGDEETYDDDEDEAEVIAEETIEKTSMNWVE